MPYQAFYEAAEGSNYDVDRLAAAFGVSFEQVCHRLTTLQREGSRGVPFFFLRVAKAGNVTKRFNATSFQIAEYGGACPVWNFHTSIGKAKGRGRGGQYVSSAGAHEQLKQEKEKSTSKKT